MSDNSEVVEINHYEMVPGTVQLIDITGTLDVQKMEMIQILFYNHNLLLIQMIHFVLVRVKEDFSFVIIRMVCFTKCHV